MALGGAVEQPLPLDLMSIVHLEFVLICKVD